MVVRVSRNRASAAPKESLHEAFEINFRLETTGGITASEAKAHVDAAMRYFSGASLFKVAHPTKDRDPHGRKDYAMCGQRDYHVTAKPIT